MTSTNTPGTKTFLVYTTDDSIIPVQAASIRAQEDFVWLVSEDGTEVAFFPTFSLLGIVDKEADLNYKKG